MVTLAVVLQSGSRLPLLLLRLKGKHTNRLSLRFVDPDLETRYSVEKEKQSGAAFCCSCVVLLCTTLMEALIDPWWVSRRLCSRWDLLFPLLGLPFWSETT